jgi:hypothetical protein
MLAQFSARVRNTALAIAPLAVVVVAFLSLALSLAAGRRWN